MRVIRSALLAVGILTSAGTVCGAAPATGKSDATTPVECFWPNRKATVTGTLIGSGKQLYLVLDRRSCLHADPAFGRQAFTYGWYVKDVLFLFVHLREEQRQTVFDRWEGRHVAVTGSVDKYDSESILFIDIDNGEIRAADR